MTTRGQRTGRPYDHSGDSSILASTLDLLAERGYERLSLDEVAARTGRAKTTLYRRWATKDDLVLAAIRSAGRPFETDPLPDLGSLRSDLLAVIDSPWLGGAERRSAIFAGLGVPRLGSTRLADAVRTEVTEPYVDIYLRLLSRAHARGEIAERFGPCISLLAGVIPAMSSHRFNTGAAGGRGVAGEANGAGAEREYFASVIDHVVLAALDLN